MLQLDGSERFGGEWGTLALDEFAEWIRDRGDAGSAAAAAVSTPTPVSPPSSSSSSSAAREERRLPLLSLSSLSASSSSSIYLDPRFEAEELKDKRRARRYAVDISPKLLHCDGQTVDALLAAGAGSYAEFKLVGAHLVWVREEEEEEEQEKEEEQEEEEEGETEREEGKKKNKTAAAAPSAAPPSSNAFARGRLLPLPASRADVFRDRSLPLAAKRSVMRFLQQAADAVLGKGGPLAGALSVPFSPPSPESAPGPLSDEVSSPSPSSAPFAAVVASANLPRGVADAVIYGLAGADADQSPWEKEEELVTTKETGAAEAAATEAAATAAMTAAATPAPPWASAPLPAYAAALSLRRHLLSLGRYGAGSSALLAPVHGSGELPQAFVRSAAVAGGAAALRRKAAAAFLEAGGEDEEGSAAAPRVTAVELSSGQRLECGALAGEWRLLRALLPSASPSDPPPAAPLVLLPRVARCVAVLDGPPALSSRPCSSLLSAATAALVFPPRCLGGSGSAAGGGDSRPRDAVRGLLLSAATASSPEGRRLLHLSTPLARSDEGGGGGGGGGGVEEKTRAAEEAEAAEAALFGALSAIARPPEGLRSRFLPAPLPRALDHRPSALLAAFFVTETGPETGGGRGGGGGGGEGSRSLSSLLPRNAAATAPPDGRLSADDGPLASARCVLERLFPGEGVEKLLLEKKKAKNRGTDDDGDDDEEEALPAEAEAAAKQEEQGEREDDCCSSDEDAAGNLAAVLDALDAARENE
mgnify:CR=1 FL=1